MTAGYDADGALGDAVKAELPLDGWRVHRPRKAGTEPDLDADKINVCDRWAVSISITE